MKNETDNPEETLVVDELRGMEVPPDRIDVVIDDHMPACRSFCLTREVCNLDSLTAYSPYYPLRYDESAPAPLPVTEELLRWLLDIRGVEVVILTRYRANVWICPAFGWDEVFDKVVEAISIVVYDKTTEEEEEEVEISMERLQYDVQPITQGCQVDSDDGPTHA